VCGISIRTAKTTVKLWNGERHCKQWLKYPDHKLARKLVKKPHYALSKNLLQLDRSKLRRATALITGHGRFRKHLRMVGLYNKEITCRLCKQDDETASHILLECPVLGRRRIPLSRALDNKDVNVNIGLKALDLVRGTEIERHC